MRIAAVVIACVIIAASSRSAAAPCQTAGLMTPSGISISQTWTAQLNKHGLRAVDQDADVNVRVEVTRNVVSEGTDSFGSAISHVDLIYTIEARSHGGAAVVRRGALPDALDGALTEVLSRASSVEIRSEPVTAEIVVEQPRVVSGTGSVAVRCLDEAATVRGHATSGASEQPFSFPAGGSASHLVRIEPASGAGSGSPAITRTDPEDTTSRMQIVGLFAGGLLLLGGLAVVRARRRVSSPPPGKRVVLFLAANPIGTDRLALDREARDIQVELERAGHGDSFELVTRWAVQPLDLLRELRRLKPMVVHFSGHGDRDTDGDRPRGTSSNRDIAGRVTAGTAQQPAGLVFEGADGGAQLVSTEALEQAFGAAGSSVKLVVLNACYSEAQASALLAHVDCVVGMAGSISDDAARGFAIGFYGGLGERESVDAAYRQGCAAISLEGLSETERPQLRARDDVQPGQLILAI